MKKNNTTIIIIDIVLIVIAVALLIFLVALNSKKDIDTVQSDINYITEDVNINIDDSLIKEYSSDILGIKCKYYIELSKVNDVTKDSIYKSVGMYRSDGNEGINILIGNLKEEISFDEYLLSNVYAIMESSNLQKEDITVIKENVKMGGIEAFKVRYKLDGVNFYQIMTKKDSKEYVMTYSAEDKYYDKQKADNMFSTFEFI